MGEELRLTIIEHLEELRTRIIKVAVLFFSVTSVCFYAADSIVEVVMPPIVHLISITPSESFMVRMRIACIAGFFISSPYIFYHLWAFVSEALSIAEKKYGIFFGFISMVFFLAGAFFAVGIVAPVAMRFFLKFTLPGVTPMISVQSYFAFVFSLVMAFSLTFEMPFAIMFLTCVGVLNPQLLRAKRRVAIVGFFVIGACITPPDVISQLFLAFPLILLYEISIVFSKWTTHRLVRQSSKGKA